MQSASSLLFAVVLHEPTGRMQPVPENAQPAVVLHCPSLLLFVVLLHVVAEGAVQPVPVNPQPGVALHAVRLLLFVPVPHTDAVCAEQPPENTQYAGFEPFFCAPHDEALVENELHVAVGAWQPLPVKLQYA